MKRFLFPFLALPVLALLCATTANALASPRRRLSWRAAPVATTPAPAPLPAPPAPPAPVAPAPAPAPPPPTPARPAAATPKPAAPAKPSAAAPAAVPSEPSPEAAAKRFPFDAAHLEREIGSEDAMEAFRLGVPFLDARRSEEFEAGHVARAHSAPVWEDGLQERLAAILARPGFPERRARLTAPIVVYCSGGACEDSHMLAEQLFPLGFANILIYKDGFPDWAAKGRPIARGPEAK